MFERMLDKNREPTRTEIEETLGPEAVCLLETLEGFLAANYNLSRELRFPFGNEYGWGYKYSHKTRHLCYLFFEKDAFTVTLQLGSNELPALHQAYGDFLPKTRVLWEHRYPCGKGGWIHYRVLEEYELGDVMQLIRIKKAPTPQRKAT